MLYVQEKGRRGAVAIETALMFPLLVLLIFGMIEFGLYLYNRQVLTNASREGARAGIIQASPAIPDSEITDVVEAYCGIEDPDDPATPRRLVTFGSATTPTTTVIRDDPDCEFGTDLTVRLTFQYDFLVLTNFGFGPIQMMAQTVMKCE